MPARRQREVIGRRFSERGGRRGQDRFSSTLDRMRRLLAWIQGFAESLGGSGLFIIAFLDSSFLSFPEASDALIVLLTVQHPERMIFYALTTTIGSVSGCYALYSVVTLPRF